jgi:hormone-sensitive lipase
MIYRMIDTILSPKRTVAKALVIHVHGGGFVAMSSGSHQSYSRVWANQLGVPVFSIDYRLAPGD